MTPEAKRLLLRDVVALELVIVVTGAALLLPRSALLVVLVYLAAAVIAAVSGGWRAALVATVGGLAAQLIAFRAMLPAQAIAGFAGAGVVVSIAAWLAKRPRSVALTSVPLFPQESVEDVAEARKREEERAAEVQRIEEQRAAAKREKAEAERVARLAREEAERVAREKADAERVARERTEAERLAREQAEAERIAREQAEQREREIEQLKKERAEKERAEAAARALEEKQKAEAAAREEKTSRDEKTLTLTGAGTLTEVAVVEPKPIEPPKPHVAAPARGTQTHEHPKPQETPKPGILSRFFKRPETPKPLTVNLQSKGKAHPSGPVTVAKPGEKPPRKPRILLLEKRRGTADIVRPILKQRGIEIEIVERLIDAVDEIFRFRPDAFFIDTEFPDFDEVHKTVHERSPQLPIILTMKKNVTLPPVRHANVAYRPYDADVLAAIAQQSLESPNELLAKQAMLPGVTPDQYLVTCYHCEVQYDLVEADWCSCLTKERTLVCTNCLTCFCTSSPSYKERVWLDAPHAVLDRKYAERRRTASGVPANPSPEAARRPLVMLVEGNPEIQSTVHRVCSNLGYGFVVAANGQEGLDLARTYQPNLILSDTFTRNLDARAMCATLREEGLTAKMVMMTGLYADTKYKSEALRRFPVDDYLSKPVSITDLINLLQRDLEGVSGLPAQQDLHKLHRRETETASDEPYEINCPVCGQLFDTTKADWCRCVNGDPTLVCTQCSNCFCIAPAQYRDEFWRHAPATLYERRMIAANRMFFDRNPSPEALRRPSILLVEDDEDVQLIVKTVAQTMGYGFAIAESVEEGLRLARAYAPDILLCDAFTPGIDGREMDRALKDDASPSTRPVMMSGMDRDAARKYFHIDDVLPKPIEVSDLVALLKH